jgi:hypothetical protein
MNKLFINIATVFFITTNPLLDSVQPFYHPPRNLTQFASYPPQANQALNALNKLPEFRELLVKVQQEGPVFLRMEPRSNFEGLWDGSSRTIVVNTRFNPALGSIICTILFELHNAATTRYYDHLIDLAGRGLLTKDQYVEKVEHAEYDNAKNTQDLLKKGVEMGIFPESAHWPVMPNFEDHYKVQQVSGHSLFIAENYDMMNPFGRYSHFQGTISRPSWMNSEDKDELCRYIVLRAGLESTDQATANRFRKDLKDEIAFLNNGHQKSRQPKHMERNPRRIELIKIAMKGNKDFQEETKGLPFFTA